MKRNPLLTKLHHHVSGAVARGDAEAIAEKLPPLYHVTNGKPYRAAEGQTLADYRQTIKRAYGGLHGVKFVRAMNRNEALHYAATGVLATR